MEPTENTKTENEPQMLLPLRNSTGGLRPPRLTIHPDCPFTEKQSRRFLSRLVNGDNGCQCWTGCFVGDYGRVGLNGECWTTHRVAYIISNGIIPDGLLVRHKCDNPACCNPGHLELGTHKQNSNDMVERGRTNAPKGERCWSHRLKRSEVIEIKTHMMNGTMTQTDLAKMFRVNIRTINAIRTGLSWAHVPPFLTDSIPKPHRKLLDSDYLDIRNKWRNGSTLKGLALEYECRIDMIQAILSGKRGKNVPVGERVIRQNKCKLSDDRQQECLRRWLAGETQRALAFEFGMSKNGMNLMLLSLRENV